MEKNQKKGHNKKGFHLKKHRKGDQRQKNKGGNDEKPVLFQLGSIAMVSDDDRLKDDPEITTTNSIPESSSLSSSSSGNNNAKEGKLSQLQSLSDTLGSQVSGVTHVSLEPALLLSPSVQMMDREGSEQTQRNSVPILEKNLSTLSNESLFSLSVVGDHTITKDELFSYRDFKAGEILKSSELLSFCPSVHVPVDSSDIGKNFDDLEDKASELLDSDSDDKSSNSDVSWGNLGYNSDEVPSSMQSISSPITKKSKKKKKVKKVKKKTKQQQQHKQKQKKRCSCLCCKNTGPCFSCCRCPSCNGDISCCKRLKYCLCCCGLPQCCFSFCSWLFCCHCSCCSCSAKKMIDDEMAIHKQQKAESKTSHKWFCCFPSCCP